MMFSDKIDLNEKTDFNKNKESKRSMARYHCYFDNGFQTSL